MFNTILTAFQGLFSRSFWFGRFLPVAIVAAAHFILIESQFPGSLPLKTWLETGLSDQVTVFWPVGVGLVILAYALTPFIPLFRSILDGQLLPEWLHDRLLQDRFDAWRAAETKKTRAKDARGLYALAIHEKIPRLQKALKKGDRLGTVSDIASIDAAEWVARQIEKKTRRLRLPRLKSIGHAYRRLLTALRNNASNLPAGTQDASDARQAARLAGAHRRFIRILREANAEAEYRFARIFSKYPMRELLPTRVGDARLLAERYGNDTYHADFDYLWPRIQLVISKEEKEDAFSRSLGDAQSQVDFAVLTFVLALTIPLIWLPLLVFTAGTPWLFLAIGVLSPIVLKFLYELVVQAQSTFGEIVKGTIDHYRLQLLTETLHQPMPATLAEERAIWTALRQASEPGNTVDLTYSHPVTP